MVVGCVCVVVGGVDLRVCVYPCIYACSEVCVLVWGIGVSVYLCISQCVAATLLNYIRAIYYQGRVHGDVCGCVENRT